MAIIGSSPESSVRGTRVVCESFDSRSVGEMPGIVHYLYAGDRSRSGSVHPAANGFGIERRDLRQGIRVFTAERKYQVLPLFELATKEEKAKFRRSGRHWRKRHDRLTGNATREFKINFSYQCTGEEQRMFGCIARRWIVRRRDEHDRKYGENWTEVTTEAWYLDSQEVAAKFSGFSPELREAFCFLQGGDEKAVIEHSGARPSGLCARSETKYLSHLNLPQGEMRESTGNSSTRIVSMAEETFPLSLFEPPKGFHRMPAYPTWFTLARQDFTRLVQRYSWKFA